METQKSRGTKKQNCDQTKKRRSRNAKKKTKKQNSRSRKRSNAKQLNNMIIHMMINVPLVKSLVRGCTSWSKTIATPLIPAVKASAKALSMGSLPSSASIVHWLFAWAIAEKNAWEKGNESHHLKTNYTNNIAEKKQMNPQNKCTKGIIREIK